MNDTPSERSARRSLLAVVAVAVAVALGGYAGYVLYPRFDLPAAAGIGLLALAAGAGLAAFFSPCSFPLLLTLIVRGESNDGQRGNAVWVAAGAATFMLALGLLIAAGGAGIASSITFDSTPGRLLRAVVGVILIVLGLIQAGVIRANLRRFEPAIHGMLGRQARLRRHRPRLGHAVFGFAYLTAGFG